MTDLVLTKAARDELAGESSAASEFLSTLEALVIASPEDLDFAGSVLVNVKAKWKALEERRTRITRPILDAKAEVDALFKPVLEPLKRGEVVLKEKIAAYTIERNREREAAMLEVAAGREDIAALVPVDTPVGVGVKEVWDYEVVAEDTVPRRFLCVDHDRIRWHVAMADTERTPPLPIEGVRFFRRGQVRVTTK